MIKEAKLKSKVKMKGFARVQLVEKDGKIVGDTGWIGPNQVVDLGFQDYVCKTLAGLAGSKTISHMAIGVGTVPAADATTLQSETSVRVTTTNSVVASKTLQATCQFAGSSMSNTCTIQNVGLFNTSSGGTLIAGITYATSQWALIIRGQVMATLLKVFVKFGGYLKHLFEIIPSQALIFIKEGVESRRQTTLRVEGVLRAIQRCIEQSRNDFALAVSKSNKSTNQNVRKLHQLMVTLVRKLREFGEHLILNETIPSRALIFIKEGVTTMHEALIRGEDIVWSLWRHKEQSRNGFALI